MKFGHIWKSKVHQMPEMLAGACIQYKSYKKMLKKTANPQQILNRILDDAQRVDMVFNRHFNTRSDKKRILKCFMPCYSINVSESTGVNDGDLLEFARLNTLCLTKLCKKADKILRQQIFKEWLVDAKQRHIWRFLDGKVITMLEIRVGEKNINECQICFEEKNTVIIMKCGHSMCVECLLDMMGASKYNGTLHNIIAYGRYNNPLKSRCPFCRDQMALHDYNLYFKNS